MSFIPSISTTLSFLCFLTTLVALARVGAAAFSANQDPTGQQYRAQATRIHLGDKKVDPRMMLELQRLSAVATAAQSGDDGDEDGIDEGSEGSMSMTLAQMVRLSFGLGRTETRDSKNGGRDGEKGRPVNVRYVGGAELVRMPASSWNGSRRPGLLFPSCEYGIHLHHRVLLSNEV